MRSRASRSLARARVALRKRACRPGATSRWCLEWIARDERSHVGRREVRSYAAAEFFKAFKRCIVGLVARVCFVMTGGIMY